MRLPKQVAHVIENHHDLSGRVADDPLLGLIAISDLVVRQVQRGHWSPKHLEALPAKLLDKLELELETIEPVAAEAHQMYLAR